MKRWGILLLAAAVLSGCIQGEQGAGGGSAPGGAPPSASADAAADDPALASRAAAYLEAMRGGDLDALYADVTDELAAQMPKEALAETWEAVLSQLGAYQGQGGVETGEAQGMRTVAVTEDFANQSLVATFVFDSQGKVAGFNLRPAPRGDAYVPESTDAFEEVAIAVGYSDQKMNGVLTLPKGAEKPPVAVLVQGSGQSDLNETVSGVNRPFYDLAHGLAERGIASVRYNKRWYQYPPAAGPLTIEEEVLRDAQAAVRLAAADERVDGGRVIVIGHSLGGMLAPRIAAENPEVKGIVSMAGSLRPLQEILYDQNVAALEQSDDITEEQKRQALAQLQTELQKFDTLSPDDATSTLFGQPAAYWNSLNAFDVQAAARALTIPILVLQGENDFQVYADKDFTLWQEVLAGHGNATFHLYPGLSHLFMPAPDRRINLALYEVPARVEARVIDDIAAWAEGVGA